MKRNLETLDGIFAKLSTLKYQCLICSKTLKRFKKRKETPDYMLCKDHRKELKDVWFLNQAEFHKCFKGQE